MLSHVATKHASKLAALLLGALCFPAGAAWEPGTHFRVADVSGRPGLVAPDGRPFKSVGMVWAYGPERGPLAGELTAEKVIRQLQVIKELGFNTLNLYGDRFMPEMLAWCDQNELAVYFRTAYYSLADFPGELKEYPDYMDPAFREAAKDYYRQKYLAAIKDHPSVLAIDMDHRWLFPLDWGGGKRFDTPKLRPKAVAYFPKWLEGRYGTIEALNGAWDTSYASFEAILRDEKLFKNGEFRKLGNHPARVDVYSYTLWTATDFLKELAGFLQSEVPGLLVTPTTEHPECIPEVNPDPSTGIAFMSPVHYNGLDDFGRDLPGLCKLIYETRWHYDLQGGPAYVSETGFRTSTLEQKPPAKMYAWVLPPTEEQAARVYAEQFALMNVMPWLGGYGYFMLYDKWLEGDFGYLRDDGTKKPMALVGDAINQAFNTAALPDPEPQAWIYYPDYALATHRPGFQQLKSWVAIWEHPFLQTLSKRIDQFWDGLKTGDAAAGRKFARTVTKDFRRWWRGFAFTRELPDDDRPVVLLSTISEILSAKDREALLRRKTITFGPVGVRDALLRETEPWHLAAVGLKPADVRETYLRLNLTNETVSPVKVPADEAAATNSPWPWIPSAQYDRAVPCRGEVIGAPPGRYTRLEVLAGSYEGNAAPFCTLEYVDGERRPAAFGPTISDVRYEPLMTDGIRMGESYLSRIIVLLEPAQELRKIELPQAPWVRLYGIVLVNGGAAADVNVSIPWGEGNVTGTTPWWLRVAVDENGVPAANPNAKVLERFAGGEPAVVADGTHVAFLFDPLTWSGRTNEISRHVEIHQAWIDNAIRYLHGARKRE
ncbi:MAG: beta-galactosidase [Verrucomicrobiota bacterium]